MNEPSDILIHNGNKYNMGFFNIPNSFILEPYFKEFPQKRPFYENDTLYRGYFAIYEIINNELWVIDIKTEVYEDGKERQFSVINECLNGEDRIKINWFCGLIHIPLGELAGSIQIGHIPYPIYENYFLIEVQNGNVTRELYLNNDQYIEFRKRQFELFRQTDEYIEMFERLRIRNVSEEEIEVNINLNIFGYLNRILD
jgi:hypothetical protein